jgi:hypothetical protein
VSLATGAAIEINDQNRTFFLSLSRELENFELFRTISTFLHSDTNLSPLYDVVCDPDFLDFCTERSIAFLASHFCDLTPSILPNIPTATLYQILSHTSLQISSEDSLFDLISRRPSSDFDLFSLLHFEYLSVDRIAKFLTLPFHFADCHLWSAISDRLILHVQAPPSPESRISTFPFRPKSPLSGIIAHLTEKHGGSVVETGTVLITAKSVMSDDAIWAVKNLADFNTHSHYMSEGEPGQWVCWDFQEMRVTPSHYSISNGAIRSWKLEGSIDGREWTELDKRANINDLNDYLSTAAFAVTNAVECRFVRLSQTGRNNLGYDYMQLSSMELFGSLFE